VTQVPRPSDEAADELAVDPTGVLAIGSSSTADVAGGDSGRPGLPAQSVRGTGVLRLDLRRLGSVLTTLAAEALVVGSRLVGSAAVHADPTTERGRRCIATPSHARALQAAARAVELIAVDRSK